MKILIPLLALCLFGCGPSDGSDGPTAVSAKDQRDDEIVKKSGGNWDSLAEADRQTLIQDLGHGNERAAQMTFRGRTSKGGPPAPGHP